jgi:hypothetical protein
VRLVPHDILRARGRIIDVDDLANCRFAERFRANA